VRQAVHPSYGIVCLEIGDRGRRLDVGEGVPDELAEHDGSTLGVQSSEFKVQSWSSGEKGIRRLSFAATSQKERRLTRFLTLNFEL
jgi:hypothetical protein